MPRRVNLPGAEELFRPTSKTPRLEREPLPKPLDQNPTPSGGLPARAPARLQAVEDQPVTESGRVKHDEKMTIYVTADELMAVEQARLQLRAALGRTVDRGRFVRAAVALALADLEDHGTDSAVARRLSET